MDAASPLAAHARVSRATWRVGEATVTVATKAGVRGHPGLDGALHALAPALVRGRVAVEGRALDLSGAPAALPVWASAAGIEARWTVALSSAAALAAARLTLAEAPRPAEVTLIAALPWDVVGPFDTIVWRPPTDRGRRRWLAEVEAVAALLAPTGTVVAVQHKDEGAQRNERAAAAWFAEVETVGRASGWRVTLLRRPRPAVARAPDPWVTFEAPHGPARAIVGTFASEKVDPGTGVLLAALRGAGVDAVRGGRMLDLGSGTGLLARAARAGGAVAVVALDDDLAAVRSSAAQLGVSEPSGPASPDRVCHADLLTPVETIEAPLLAPASFDAVWCNPPFHVGRQVVGELSRAFVAAAHQALRPGGHAWFVVNRALPYERELARWGRYEDVTPLGERAFTVWRALRERA